MFEKEGFEFSADEVEGGVHALLLVEDADAGFDSGGIAEAGEELIAGEASLHLGIDSAFGAQHPLADVELKDGITDPGILAELFFGGDFGGG